MDFKTYMVVSHSVQLFFMNFVIKNLKNEFEKRGGHLLHLVKMPKRKVQCKRKNSKLNNPGKMRNSRTDSAEVAAGDEKSFSDAYRA